MKLFHMYIGNQFHGPQRGRDADHAMRLYANKTGMSRFVFNAKPAATVQELKMKKG